MKRKGEKLLSLVLVLLMITIVTIISLPQSVSAAEQNQLDVYPYPPEGTAASYSAFTAEVRTPGGTWNNLFTHLARMFNGDSGDPGNSNMPTGFVMFDSAGEVEVKVTYHGGPLKSAKVWPQAYEIEPEINGQVMTFSVTGAKNIVLEVNDNIYSALHIFANPIDTDIPSPDDPNVMYFDAGVHDFSNDNRIKRQSIHAHQNHNYKTTMDYIDVPSGTTVYLAPGAIVKAQIRTNPYLNEPGWDTKPIKKDITIRGRGILDLSQWCGDFTDAARATQPEMPGIVAFYSKNVKIEGLVVVNPERQSVNVIGSSNVIIDNIKGFTSMHEGDGIVLVMDNNDVTVKNSFVRTSDDALVTGNRSSNILWENNVVASMRVHSIMINAGDTTNYVARDIYIINSNAYPGIRGTIGVYSAGGLVDNVLLENIEIERTRYGSMLEIYPFQMWNQATGSISNVTLKNINYASNPYDLGSQVGGISETEYVDGVHFENVKVDGKLVTDSASGNLSIGSYASNVTFNGKPDSGILTLPPSIVPADSDGRYYQIYNRKRTGKSLYDNSGTVSYGDGKGYEYQWVLENNDGFLRFRNRLTGNYMNIEANNGRVQTGAISGWSADWMPVGSEYGYFQLRNRKHGSQHIHTQNDYVQSGKVGGGDWTSDQWVFVEHNNYEAEDASLAGGAMVDNDQLNYSGTGFAAGYDSIGATTTFTVNTASEGRYDLDLRYANATGAAKTISLYVNDIKIKQISLPSLANGDTWGDKVETINLNAGDNTIAFKYDSDDSGNVSLDYITVTAYNKYEAEDASLSEDAVVSNDHQNYSGNGYVTGYNSNGATTTFTVNNSSALTRSYYLDLRYANATGATKTISLYVNGIKLRQISLRSLENSDTWSDQVELVTLKSGLNTISYKYDDGDSGNVNLDYITLNLTTSNSVTVYPAELVAHWKFDEGFGTIIDDSSGKGNTGKLVNNPAWNSLGKFEGALAFSSGSRAEINAFSFLEQTGDETVSLWFKTSQPADGYYDIFKQENRFTALQMAGGNRARVVYWPGGSSTPKTLSFPWTYNDDNWHHYISSYSQKTGLKIYVDGKVVASDATNLGPLPRVTNKILLGADVSGGEAYNGQLDDVRVFNGPLTEAQVMQLMYGDQELTLQSITAPAAITRVASGTAKTAAALGLPTTIELVTDKGKINTDVTWDVNASSYDPTDMTEQTFTVDGIATLPEFVKNTSNVSLTTSISVTAKPTELVAHWKFNEGSGTTAVDSSGKGNNGTLINNPTWNNSGKIDGALEFSGGSSKARVEVNPSATLNQTGDETVSLWFKTSKPANGYSSIFRQDNRFTALQLTDKGTAQVAYWPNGSSSHKSVSFPWTYSNNQWHHYVASYSQKTGMKIYVDGVLVASDATNLGPLPSVTSKIMLGSADYGESYTGLLDDVRIFNGPLTQAQVTQLMNIGLGMKLQSIPAPAAITGVVNGTAKTAADLGLPATVELVTDLASMNADVTWDVDASSYDPAVQTEQIFAVSGIVTLPEGVTNPNNVPLTTSISVTVLSVTTIPKVAVDGVSLNKTAASLSVGATDSLVATVTPTNASNKTVTFTVDHDNVVKLADVILGADGATSATVKALSAGTATVTVETADGQYKDYYNVTVNDVQVPVEGVSLNKSSSTLIVGNTDELIATVSSADATDKTVTFTLEGSAVTVSSAVYDEVSGTTSVTVSAVSPGNAKVIATMAGGQTAEYEVTVLAATVPATGVTLNKKAASLSVGATDSLVATITPTNASNKKVTFTVDNDHVVELADVILGADGATSATVKALSAGTATVTVETADGQYKDYYNVTVNEVQVSATGVTLNKTSAVLNIGATDSLTAVVSPADATDKTVTYAVEGSVVTISSAVYDAVSGTTSVTVTAVSAGRAKITAMTADGGHKAVYEVYVNSGSSGNPNPGNSGNGVVLKGINTDSKAYSLEVGQTQALEVTAEYSDGTRTIVTDKASYTSSDPTVITVSANGVVKVVDTGSAKVTVSYQGKTTVVEVTGYEKESGGVTSPDPETSTPIFVDIDNHAWAKLAIETLANQGIIKGTSATTFEPGKKITRADFVTLLVRALGLKAEISENFQDVDQSDYYYEALGIVKVLGIAKGTGEGMFNPKEEISRQDMMVLVVRALQVGGKWEPNGSASDLNSFADASDIAGYAVDAVAALVQEGIITGRGEGLISPNATTTRAEVAVIVYRLMNQLNPQQP
ncbi:LamG-like jellyroll fold domain-containing protein [Paenibacillus sp. GCM10027629]|uniref:LamG-like jellyroll fold domain-containing protein n=1 Tax=Paenibacillus sp. GCM10027629 TaxID=3273414 RepID=UPI00363DFC8C